MLYIVATPIGNLEDITMRALRVLSEADFILCEDTRVTKHLLDHYNIKTATISYHQHSDMQKVDYILSLLADGKTLALVSDAGTPGISDPGGKLVQAVLDRFSEENSEAAKIEVIPGPSAVTAALSISGIPTDKFTFMGFPPHKKGRQTFIRKILESEYPAVVYESKHRIIKFLEELRQSAKDYNAENAEKNTQKTGYFKKSKNKDDKNLKKYIDLTSVVVCRELSKMHETIYRGDIEKIIKKVKDSDNDQKGEFVVIVGK